LTLFAPPGYNRLVVPAISQHLLVMSLCSVVLAKRTHN
jgi:hypothetical protein